jgi:coenzyme F420-dependent glucose-6-phosphate dehydrogenase
LLDWLKQAEAAGFQHATCSDHLMPWSERQAHSGFSWAWLGAGLQATRLSLGTVCSPGDRYHPVVVAQAAATLAEMFPDRFWMAVGSGEALNEHVTGASWPSKPERNARLLECVAVMRALWAGERVSHEGRIRVHDARLYSLPPTKPLLFGAALTEETAHWVGGWADGLLTVAKAPEELRRMAEAFQEGGGAGKPMFLQVGLAWGASEAEALETVRTRWPHAVLDEGSLADVQTPWQIDALTAMAGRDDYRGRFRLAWDAQQLLDMLGRDAAVGFQRLYLHHVGRDVAGFIDVCREHILPAFA